jgi:dipeptidyl aminopeptidase/acylaminoacyl peptidase
MQSTERSVLSVVDARTGGRRQLTDPLPPGEVFRAAWSSVDELLLWVDPTISASATAGGLPLYAVPVNGGPAVKVGGGLIYPDYVASRPGATTVALTTGGGREAWNNQRLEVANLPGVAQPIGTAAPGSIGSLAWSPDGSTLAYVSGPEASGISGGEAAHQLLLGRRIYLQDVPTGVPRKLLNDPTYRDDRAKWSADGQWLLVSRFDIHDVASLWLVSADGKQATRVADNLGPFDQYGSTWFGYYGHVQWELVADYRP